jgi:hypothetical protein
MSMTEVFWKKKGEPASYLDLKLSEQIDEKIVGKTKPPNNTRTSQAVVVRDSKEKKFYLKLETINEETQYILSEEDVKDKYFTIEKITLQTVKLLLDFQIDSKFIANMIKQHIPEYFSKVDIRYENEFLILSLSGKILQYDFSTSASFKLSFEENLLNIEDFGFTNIPFFDSWLKEYINDSLMKNIKDQLKEIIFGGLKKIPEFSASGFKFYFNVLTVDFPPNIIRKNGDNILLSSHVTGVIDSHPTKLENFILTTGRNPTYGFHSLNIILNNSFYFNTSIDFTVQTSCTKIVFKGETTLIGDPRSSLLASILTNGTVFSEPIHTKIPKKGYKFATITEDEKNFILLAMTGLRSKIDDYLNIISEKKNDVFLHFVTYINVLQRYLVSMDLKDHNIVKQIKSLEYVIISLIEKAKTKEYTVEDGKKHLIFCTLLSFSYLMLDLIKWKFPEALDKMFYPDKVKFIFEEIQNPRIEHLHSSLLYNSTKYPLIELALIYFGIGNNLQMKRKFGIEIKDTGYSVKYHKQLFWNMPATFYEVPVKEWVFEKISGLSSHVKIFTFNNNFKKYVGVCSGFNFKRVWTHKESVINETDCTQWRVVRLKDSDTLKNTDKYYAGINLEGWEDQLMCFDCAGRCCFRRLSVEDFNSSHYQFSALNFDYEVGDQNTNE